MAACVTRILELRGFDAKVKTRDVHAAFADFGESFKIKWIDDHGLYLVFNDAVTGEHSFSILLSEEQTLIPGQQSVSFSNSLALCLTNLPLRPVLMSLLRLTRALTPRASSPTLSDLRAPTEPTQLALKVPLQP